MSLVDPARLLDRVRELAESELLARFRSLGPGDVQEKLGVDGRSEIVTVADRQMERKLTALLTGLLPGSVVVGEEASAENPSLLELISGADPVWLVDPLDGTAHFARGEESFGTMLALAVAGELRLSLIYLPVRDVAYVADKGDGLWCEGQRVFRRPTERRPPLGSLHTWFAPDSVTSMLEGQVPERVHLVQGASCAATEYTDVVSGVKDFVQYYRLLPWDHAPGVLAVQEAGGLVRYAAGTEYQPTHREGVLIAASDEDVFRCLAEPWLREKSS